MKRKTMIAIIVVLLLSIAGGLAYYKYLLKQEETVIRYLASDEPVVEIDGIAIARGSEVLYKPNKSDEQKAIIEYEGKEYEIESNHLVDTRGGCVLEKEVVALRSATLLKNMEGIEIGGFIDKGVRLEVWGFDYLKADGSVNSYLIKAGNEEGFISGSYVATDYYETAYDSSIYGDVFYNRGGNPVDIEYYPRITPILAGNSMPEKVNGLYINAEAVKNVDKYLEIAKDSGINAFVVDIKDCYLDTQLAYESPTMRKYAPSTDNVPNSFEEYQSAIRKLKDAGYYVIGRITAFKDDAFAKDHPEEAIFTDGTPYYYGGVQWPSIYSRLVWEYDLALAKEAVEEMGFNEIQFDYVRLPEYVPEDAEVHNVYGETPLQALTSFLRYASDELHKMNAYLSADVFGETSGNYASSFGCFVTAYGQFWPAFSNIVDAMSSMPYPDHFSNGAYGVSEPWANPGEVMSMWARATRHAQDNTYDKALCRTWIQAQGSDVYDIYYGEDEIKGQIDALSSAGINDGYLTWNAGSNLYLYNIYKSVLH